jgi:hypothetical protein
LGNTVKIDQFHAGNQAQDDAGDDANEFQKHRLLIIAQVSSRA